MPAQASNPNASIKETLTSIMIAFVMAFVFRMFVIEAYVIPTGSMAPTLLGRHVRLIDPQTGQDFATNFSEETGKSDWAGALRPKSPSALNPVTPPSPFNPGDHVRSGDRILVQKYLPFLNRPTRFDVTVFKAPHEPWQNYIKRLVGLPNEMLALVDGDVFTRPNDGQMPALSAAGMGDFWTLPGWTIQRKPERIQRAVWQPVFDSRLHPVQTLRDGQRWYRQPWKPTTGGWNLENRRLEYTGTGPTALDWDTAARPILDTYTYNEDRTVRSPALVFPVSDVRLVASVRPRGTQPLTLGVQLAAREQEFRLDIAQGKARLRMRPAATEGAEPKPWTELASADVPSSTLAPDRVSAIEFWHADQALSAWVDGKRIVEATYDWDASTRADRAVTLTAEERMTMPGQPLAAASVYRRAELRLELSGPTTIEHTILQRDLHYQAAPTLAAEPGSASRPMQVPGLATHPSRPVLLDGNSYFMCGDNSPSSLDSRLIGKVEPWVAHELGPALHAETTVAPSTKPGLIPGIVPSELVIGRAFIVYFPSVLKAFDAVPAPDFGRMRWIW